MQGLWTSRGLYEWRGTATLGTVAAKDITVSQTMLRHAKPDTTAIYTHGNFGKALDAQARVHGTTAADEARLGVNPMKSS